jgi:hypothetical protein
MRPTTLRGVSIGGCLVLLASIVVGGALNDGYDQWRDYVSALSGRGSTAALVGMVGLLGFSTANAAAGWALRPHSRTGFAALELAAASGVVVAFSRIQCPDGAALCSLGDGVPADTLDHLHGLGVVGYEIGFVVGVVAAGWWLLRATDAVGARATALALFGLAATSAVLLGVMPDDAPGSVQRLWLTVNSVAVIWVAALGSRVLTGDVGDRSEQIAG